MTTKRGWLLKALNRPGTAVDISVRTGVSRSECAHALTILHDAYLVDREKVKVPGERGRPQWRYYLAEVRDAR
jgi:predicted transcriptional regulator